MNNESEYGTQKWLPQKTPIATGKVRYGIPDLLAISKTADVRRELVIKGMTGNYLRTHYASQTAKPRLTRCHTSRRSVIALMVV